MHRRISHTLNTLRQGLAAKLGGDFIDHACRLAGHSWCDSCLLTPAAIIHWFLVQILHGNTALTHVSLLAGRAFTASAFLPGPRPTPAGRLPDRPPRNGQGIGLRHRDGGSMARPSHLPGRRLVVLHARHCRAAGPLRPARQPGQGLRLPGGSHPGAVPRRHRVAPGGFRGAPLRSHDMAGIAGILPCSRPAISCWLTAVSARSPIWPC